MATQDMQGLPCQWVALSPMGDTGRDTGRCFELFGLQGTGTTSFYPRDV